MVAKLIDEYRLLLTFIIFARKLAPGSLTDHADYLLRK